MATIENTNDSGCNATPSQLLDLADKFFRAVCKMQVGHVAAMTAIMEPKVRNALSLHFDEVEQDMWKFEDQIREWIAASKKADA